MLRFLWFGVKIVALYYLIMIALVAISTWGTCI